MRGWQANKKRPAMLGLCPKLKYPPFYGGIIIAEREEGAGLQQKDKKIWVGVFFLTFLRSVSILYVWKIFRIK